MGGPAPARVQSRSAVSPERLQRIFVLKHKFVVGQIVELARNPLVAAAVGAYEIRQQMPLSDVSSDSPRYRVKSVAENYERVARENELTLSTPPALIALQVG
jgi:hypothetical protein